MALIVAILLALAHGTPPAFNSPDVQGPCWSWEHDELEGAQQLHWGEDYSHGWAPYVVLNGQDTTRTSCNGFPSAYVSAGDLGQGFDLTLRSEPMGALPAGAVGFVAWSLTWNEPTYTGAGWTMLADVDAWQRMEQPLFLGGEIVGWRDHGTWPLDPDLVGLRVFYQGLVLWPDPDHAGALLALLSGTWVLWFT